MRTISKIRLAISYYCELNCQHCYVPQQLRKHYDDIMSNELSTEQINNFISYLTNEYGLEKVDITGGEALLTKVWPRTKKVVSHAVNKGLEVQINTTGSGNITPDEIYDVFKDHLDKLLLHVSLDGVNEAYVDTFRGRKGAYKASISFMERALELGIRVRTRLTMTPNNINDIVPCYEMVSNLGVSSFMCKPVNIAGNSLKNKLETLTSEQLRLVQLDLLNYSVYNKTELHVPAPIAVTEADIPEGANVQLFYCLCGRHLIYIAYNGDVFPCTYMAGMKDSSRYIIGNIKDENFEFSTIWENPNTYSVFRSANKNICTAHRLTLLQSCN